MEYSLFLILSPIAVGILFFTVVAVWSYRRERVGRALLIYFLLVILFLLANVLELLSDSDETTLFWAKMQHPLVSFIPVVWFGFALAFTGFDQKKSHRVDFLLTIVPAISTVLVMLFPELRLYYQSVTYTVINGYSTVDPEYGFWFWIGGAHIYTLLIYGAILIVRSILSRGSLFRSQAIWIVLGVTLPIVANFIYILPLPIFEHKDYTPIAFALAGIFFFIGIYWQRLLQVIPVARNLVVDEMEMGIVILDRDERLVDYNRAAADLLEIRINMVGSGIEKLPRLQPLLVPFRNGSLAPFETTLRTGGTDYCCDVQVKPIHSSGRQNLGTLITITDVTLRVKLIEEKTRLLLDMEETNKELRDTQLRLIHREKLASIGQISAGVAHELKNPLAFLQSNYRMLRKHLNRLGIELKAAIPRERAAEIEDILSDSEEGFRRILDVVNSLLQFSSPGSSAASEAGFHDIHNGLDNTLKIIEGLLHDSVQVVREYGELPAVKCNINELNQVFLNILTNAAHAVNGCLGRDGIIRIRTLSAGESIVCEISNNGPPIEPAIIEHIFEPFYTTKDSNQGTGLGLSIAWDIIVKRHRGEIAVTSSIDETVFRIVLPVAPD